MKQECVTTVMKPLASQGSETGSRGNISNNNNGGNTEEGTNFHLVGILNPDNNTSRCKGWIFIVASKEIPEEMDEIKKATSYLGQLRFSPDQRRELLSHFSPKKMTSAHECLYAGKYFINDWRGQPLKLKVGSHSSKKSSVAIEDHVEFLQSQKWKFLVDELDEYCMFLLPVDSNTGVVIDGVNLEGNVTSGPPIRRGGAGGRIIRQQERKGWKGEQFSLPMGLFITREQWKALMGCLQTLHENLLGGGKQRSAGLLRSKNRKQHELLKTENDACGNVNKSGFLKWITKRNRKGGFGGKRSLARANNNYDGCVDDGEEEEDDVGEDAQGEGDEQKKLIKVGRKSDELKKYFQKKKKKISRESDAKQGKGAEKNNGKVKRINFSVGKGQGNKNIIKKKKQNEETIAAAATTFETADEMDKDTQLVRIELKPDPTTENSSFKFCSGDLFRLKVTMYNDGTDVDFINEKKENESCYQVEIDFVQNFMCETDTLDACRCRRITKLLKRTIAADLNWEKGIHISGKQFALCWIPYLIPGLESEEVEKKHGRGTSVEEGEENADELSMGLLDSKFRVTDFQYELQIRFYQKDDEQSHYILSACSCFPLNVNMMVVMETGAKSANELSWCAASSDISGGGDILQVIQDFEEDKENQEAEVAGKNASVITCQMIMVKSLSATEFDV